jgi:hypothetical protein
MSHYLDRHEFHAELTVCKKKNDLSGKALEMFKLLAREVSRTYYFENDADRKDAQASAMQDLWKYWRGFKECNVVQLEVQRNLVIDDSLTIHIHNCNKPLTYIVAAKQNLNSRQFEIGKNINGSLANMITAVKFRDLPKVEIFVDKIKNKITLMDKHNGDDLSVKSFVSFESGGKEPYIRPNIKKKDKKTKEYKEWKELSQTKFKELKKQMSETGINLTYDDKGDYYSIATNRMYFSAPPNAFSYFTTVTRNGILKSIGKLHPKGFKGNKLSLDNVNRENNGMYNL